MRYFVLHLSDADFKPFPEAQFEVQKLDSQGKCVTSHYLNRDEENRDEENRDGGIICTIAVMDHGETLPQSLDSRQGNVHLLTRASIAAVRNKEDFAEFLAKREPLASAPTKLIQKHHAQPSWI